MIHRATSRQRLLAALNRQTPDRLPVTTHHLMPSFLDRFLDGASNREFFDRFDLDAIHWTAPLKERNTSSWRILKEEIRDQKYPTVRHRFVTPRGELTLVLQSNEHTAWLTEHPVKEKSDIDLIGEFYPAPQLDVDAVNREAAAFGDRGIVRGHVCCFDGFGQPGCWQDAACLVGIERLIMATFDDPEWVHTLLTILQQRKLAFVESLRGARYDLIEFGGGDASSTVISPAIFDRFVSPYDAPVIEAAHDAGMRIVYHTCGGMMPFLERLAAMKPDAMETFTPAGMGGDVDLAEARRRLGDTVCMIGGFDQLHHLNDCTPAQTRAEVRRCYEEAGRDGGFILSPSDHFFDAELELITAFADEARSCVYT